MSLRVRAARLVLSDICEWLADAFHSVVLIVLIAALFAAAGVVAFGAMFLVQRLYDIITLPSWAVRWRNSFLLVGFLYLFGIIAFYGTRGLWRALRHRWRELRRWWSGYLERASR